MYFDRDYRRPRFSDYFDPRDASDEAQRAAFERWMATQPSREVALARPELPATLRQRVIAQVGRERMREWLPHVSHDSITFCANISSSWLLSPDRTIADFTPAIFEERFGRQVRENAAIVTCKDKLIGAVAAHLGELEHARKRYDHAQKKPALSA